MSDGAGDGTSPVSAAAATEREVQELTARVVELLNRLPFDRRDGLRDEVIAAIRDETDRDAVSIEEVEDRVREAVTRTPDFPPGAFGVILLAVGAGLTFLVAELGLFVMALGAAFVASALAGWVWSRLRGKR